MTWAIGSKLCLIVVGSGKSLALVISDFLRSSQNAILNRWTGEGGAEVKISLKPLTKDISMK